jgi:hypothetical protein
MSPGEEFYSVLLEEKAELKRLDYSVEAWEGPPENALGWWKSRIPTAESRRTPWAPSDVMLDLLEQLEHSDREDLRYVLALLLVRRRVVRVEEGEAEAGGRDCLVLYCPRRDARFQVPVVMPDEQRIAAIQEELARLLAPEPEDQGE